MALCINCNIAVHANQQYEYNALSMSSEIVSIIEEWTAQEVTDGDRICQECINLILIELNNRNENNIGDRQLGHQSVCVWCGISISTRTGRRSRPLPDGRPERAYVANIISPRQIPANARACNACWQRAHNNIHEVMEPPREAQVTIDSRNLMDDFKIAGAILNNFHPVLTDRPEAQTILERANQRMNMHNYLADHVIGHQLNRRRASFIQINAEIPQLNMFPTM